MKSRYRKMMLGLSLLLLLLMGCTNRARVVIDRTRPHKLTQDISVPVSIRLSDGRTVEAWMTARAGDGIVPQELIGQ